MITFAYFPQILRLLQFMLTLLNTTTTITDYEVEVVGSSPIKGPRCFLEQETLPLFTIELKQSEGLMEDWLKCQISPIVKYRQNQNYDDDDDDCECADNYRLLRLFQHFSYVLLIMQHVKHFNRHNSYSGLILIATIHNKTYFKALVI